MENPNLHTFTQAVFHTALSFYNRSAQNVHQPFFILIPICDMRDDSIDKSLNVYQLIIRQFAVLLQPIISSLKYIKSSAACSTAPSEAIAFSYRAM